MTTKRKIVFTFVGAVVLLALLGWVTEMVLTAQANYRQWLGSRTPEQLAHIDSIRTELLHGGYGDIVVDYGFKTRGMLCRSAEKFRDGGLLKVWMIESRTDDCGKEQYLNERDLAEIIMVSHRDPVSNEWARYAASFLVD